MNLSKNDHDKVSNVRRTEKFEHRPYKSHLIHSLWMHRKSLQDYRGFNVHQQMAVLQNQWQLNGGKIVDEARVRYLCARFAHHATNPTHAIWFMRSHSRKCWKQTNNAKLVMRSPKRKCLQQLFYVCFNGALYVDFFKHISQINFLHFCQIVCKWLCEKKKIK